MIKTISTAGDMHLGGADFDHAVLNHCIKEITEERNIPFDDSQKNFKRSSLRLLEACREAKCMLSDSDDHTISVDALFPNEEEEDFVFELRRAELEAFCEPLF